MNLRHIRRSNVFRISALFLIFDFILFQNLSFAETQIQFQQETGNYQSVKPADRPFESDLAISESDSLPNPIDFLNESPLSSPTPEIKVDEMLVEVRDASLRGSVSSDAEAISDPQIALLTSFARNDGRYDFDFYSFEDALELIRPEFVAAIPMRSQLDVVWKCCV